MQGIYKITNLINGKVYVGSSVNIHQRWKREKNAAYNPNDGSYNYPLSRAFRKYGIENFSFEVLEECSQAMLIEREQYYVDVYDSLNKGYNQVNPTQSGTFFSPQIINDIKRELEINKTDSTEVIGQKYGISGRQVRAINTGESWFEENRKYPIRQSLTAKKHYYCSVCGKEIVTNSKYCIDCGHKSERKVTNRPTSSELINLLKEYNGNFVQVSRLFNVTDNTIRKWCKGYDIPHHSIDYKIKPNKNKQENKKIAQIDKNTNQIIAIFTSPVEASRAINKKSNHIIEVCQGKGQTAYGYKWKYLE